MVHQAVNRHDVIDSKLRTSVTSASALAKRSHSAMTSDTVYACGPASVSFWPMAASERSAASVILATSCRSQIRSADKGPPRCRSRPGRSSGATRQVLFIDTDFGEAVRA